MDKATHGTRLGVAMAAKRLTRQDVADHVERNVRTVTNWTSGKTMPNDAERAALRSLLGDYDNPGDPVETAILDSELTDDRQYELLAFYKRLLREQREWSASAQQAVRRMRSEPPLAASDEHYSIADEAEETQRST